MTERHGAAGQIEILMRHNLPDGTSGADLPLAEVWGDTLDEINDAIPTALRALADSWREVVTVDSSGNPGGSGTTGLPEGGGS